MSLLSEYKATVLASIAAADVGDNQLQDEHLDEADDIYSRMTADERKDAEAWSAQVARGQA